MSDETGDAGGPLLYGVVVLTRRGASTDVSVYGPSTSKKTAEAAEKAFSTEGTPAQLITMKKLPKLGELRSAGGAGSEGGDGEPDDDVGG
jgi:hypothetical protein